VRLTLRSSGQPASSPTLSSCVTTGSIELVFQYCRRKPKRSALRIRFCLFVHFAAMGFTGSVHSSRLRRSRAVGSPQLITVRRARVIAVSSLRAIGRARGTQCTSAARCCTVIGSALSCFPGSRASCRPTIRPTRPLQVAAISRRLARRVDSSVRLQITFTRDVH
jgi:hypothetical protein